MSRKALSLTRSWSVVAMFAIGGGLPPSFSKTIEVRCSLPGHSIGRALERAESGDVISVQGTCQEKVVITTGYITINGFGSGIVRGGGPANQVFNPLIRIDGAQGYQGDYVWRTVQAKEFLLRTAQRFHSNVALRNNTVGLAVAEGSTAELADSTIDGNAAGVGLLTSSSLVLKGRVSVSNNQDIGFDITGNSTVEIRGAQVDVNNNARHGMSFDGSRLVLLGIPQSQGSSLSLRGNGGNGILLGQSSLSFFGAPGANRINISNNRGFGIRAVLGARILSPQGAALLQVEGNPTGIAFESDSGALIVGGLTVRNGEAGVLADGSGVVMLISTPEAPASITGNTSRDFDARFGSRIRLIGVSVGPKIACEANVLKEGLACP